MVNYLGYKGTLRYDLTSSRQFSLSSQTVQIIDDITEPVHATAFFIPDKTDEIIERQRTEDLLSEYKNQSNGLVMKYKLVAETEADLKNGKISVESPIGKGLLGKKIGEIAEIQVPKGTIKLEINKITRD